MKQLIYHSRPFGFDEAMLAGILSQARRNNPKMDITGALVCRQDMYIQLIEGPDEAIDRLFERICADDRHDEVKLLNASQVTDRMFPNWEMFDDSAPSMTWSPDEVESGSIQSATEEELRAVFRKIANKAGG